jgi:hypothetical protein
MRRFCISTIVRLRAQMRQSLVRHVPTISTVLHTLIDVHQSYVPFWLLGVVGADLRPDNDDPTMDSTYKYLLNAMV